jgi:hypothetical protein
MHPCIKFASADAPEVSAEKNAALKPRIELNTSDKFRRIESPGTLSAQTAGRKKTPPRARQGYGLFSFSSVSASLVIHVSARGELAGSGAQKARRAAEIALRDTQRPLVSGRSVFFTRTRD